MQPENYRCSQEINQYYRKAIIAKKKNKETFLNQLKNKNEDYSGSHILGKINKKRLTHRDVLINFFKFKDKGGINHQTVQAIHNTIHTQTHTKTPSLFEGL